MGLGGNLVQGRLATWPQITLLLSQAKATNPQVWQSTRSLTRLALDIMALRGTAVRRYAVHSTPPRGRTERVGMFVSEAQYLDADFELRLCTDLGASAEDRRERVRSGLWAIYLCRCARGR